MTQLSDEIVERMVAHFRRVSEKYAHVKSGSGNFNEELAEVRAIVAELPKPIDPDVLAVGAILGAWLNDGGSQQYRNGDAVGIPGFQRALSTYKHIKAGDAA